MALSARGLRLHWRASPWLHWLAVAALVAFYFLVVRLQSLSALVAMSAAPSERTFGRKLAGVLLGLLEDLLGLLEVLLGLLEDLLGLLEDLLVAELLLLALAVVELLRLGVRQLIPNATVSAMATRAARGVGHAVRFAVALLPVLLALSFATIDKLLVRAREIHFTYELVRTYWRERNEGAGTLELEDYEVAMIIATMAAMVATALAIAVFYVACVDLSLAWTQPAGQVASSDELATSPNAQRVWSPTRPETDETPSTSDVVYVQLNGAADKTDLQDRPAETRAWTCAGLRRLPRRQRLVLGVVAAAMAYAALVAATSAVAHAAHPVVVAIALNASLNELFRGVLGVIFTPNPGSGKIDSAAYYLQPATETFELFEDDVLYRTTTGFTGPLAFNVSVDDGDPPNVLVLGLESSRYLDSLYLASNSSASAAMKQLNFTLTPNFDRWAKRGVTFSNMWASWQTSRSLESILFSQVVYDSLPESGTSRGRVDTKLVALPQLFSAKGYETIFTTGGNTSYDQWDKFLPAHGFETVLGAVDMKKIAEQSYNISQDDWWGPARRAFIWGVHDDVSFPIVGDMMIQRVAEQKQRVARGEPKRPFFLTHYTISSHFPFRARPAWLDNTTLPDFSPLCAGWEDKCEIIRDYARLRYFADMELGKFLDTLATAGVLNDTVVVMVGDHGQAPEMGLANPVYYDTAIQHVAAALVAEGCLGQSAGLVLDDASHQNDIQNTLADIVGVGAHGFLQTGVGRSLKRQVAFGERLVWSNNPWRRMSVVRGHERFVYDGQSNRIALFDTLADPLETTDLLPTRSAEEVAAWMARWRAGRRLTRYYKKRWDDKCLAQVRC